jgi:hypothetical protein
MVPVLDHIPWGVRKLICDGKSHCKISGKAMLASRKSMRAHRQSHAGVFGKSMRAHQQTHAGVWLGQSPCWSGAALHA